MTRFVPRPYGRRFSAEALSPAGRESVGQRSKMTGAITVNIGSIGLLKETASAPADNSNVLTLSGDLDLALELTGSAKDFTVDATGFGARLDVIFRLSGHPSRWVPKAAL